MKAIPVNAPAISPESKKYVIEALETGWISSAGPFITRFEEEFAAYLGVKHAVTTTSGTTALHLALLTLGIGAGDEVIVPDFTMIASIFAVIYTGAKPVFVDIDPETFCIDPALIEAKITPRTKAIMPVHIYGHACEMDEILAIAKRHGLAVIEDAAEAHGGEYGGRKCGSFGDINCFSFYGNKIITTGEGGMVVTDDDALAARARRLKDLAHSEKKRFWHEEVGYNYRMTNLQAALGLGELQNIGTYLRKKADMAAAYGRRLSGVKGLVLPVTKPGVKNVFWMYSVVLGEGFPLSRDAFRAALKERGIDTREFFPSSAAQPAIQKLHPSAERFPVSEYVARQGLYLPSGLAITPEEIDRVCDAVMEILA